MKSPCLSQLFSPEGEAPSPFPNTTWPHEVLRTLTVLPTGQHPFLSPASPFFSPPAPPQAIPSASVPSHSPDGAPRGPGPVRGVGSRAPGQLEGWWGHFQALPQVPAQVWAQGPWKGLPWALPGWPGSLQPAPSGLGPPQVPSGPGPTHPQPWPPHTALSGAQPVAPAKGPPRKSCLSLTQKQALGGRGPGWVWSCVCFVYVGAGGPHRGVLRQGATGGLGRTFLPGRLGGSGQP